MVKRKNIEQKNSTQFWSSILFTTANAKNTNFFLGSFVLSSLAHPQLIAVRYAFRPAKKPKNQFVLYETILHGSV